RSFPTYQPRSLPPRSVTLLLNGSPASHPSTYAQLHTQADRTEQLSRLAEEGIAVWLIHHPHQGNARAGQWSRGTGSLPASVDIVLEMHPFRPDDPDDCERFGEVDDGLVCVLLPHRAKRNVVLISG